MLPPDWRISFQRVQDAYFHFPLKTIPLASLVRRITLRSPFLYFLHPLPPLRTNTEPEVALFPATIFPLYPTLKWKRIADLCTLKEMKTNSWLISCSVFHSLWHHARKRQGTWAEFFEPNKKSRRDFYEKIIKRWKNSREKG